MTEAGSRAVPFYCPYCGDEVLRMFDPSDGTTGHGQWRCESCQRVFALKYVGMTGGWGTQEDLRETQASTGVPGE